MNALNFKSASALSDYVNTLSIAQSKIVAIRILDHQWWLFWYT